MTCYLCTLPIAPGQLNMHHTTYKNEGGTDTAPTHRDCHVALHSSRDDFRTWGKRSAETRAWAFNLKNVRTHPAYEFDRAYYRAMYAH